VYCPRCGQQQTSEELRFCARCGLKLEAVRATIPAEEPAPDAALSFPARREAARVRDFGAGVLLTALCVLLTSAVIALGNVDISGAIIVFASFLIPVFLASGRLLGAIYSSLAGGKTARARPKDLGLGVALMSVGTTLSLSAAILARSRWGTPIFFLSFFASLTLLLVFSRTLLREARNFFSEGEDAAPGFEPARTVALTPQRATTASLEEPAAASGLAALPPAEGVPVALFGGRGDAPAEPLPRPASVTERTTSLLERE
jgi:hypothetical protein